MSESICLYVCLFVSVSWRGCCMLHLLSLNETTIPKDIHRLSIHVQLSCFKSCLCRSSRCPGASPNLPVCVSSTCITADAGCFNQSRQACISSSSSIKRNKRCQQSPIANSKLQSKYSPPGLDHKKREGEREKAKKDSRKEKHAHSSKYTPCTGSSIDVV